MVMDYIQTCEAQGWNYHMHKKRNCLFPVTVRKNRVGRSLKKKKIALFFWSKMCVLCMFYVDWELE